MITANILLALVLTGGVVTPDNKDYWGGYASAIIATQVMKPVGADIYEGKPKVKGAMVPSTVNDVPEPPVKSDVVPTPVVILPIDIKPEQPKEVVVEEPQPKEKIF